MTEPDPLRRLLELRARPRRRVIGLLSGTSADGTDAALCELEGAGETTRLVSSTFVTTPFPRALRERIFRLAQADASGTSPMMARSEPLCVTSSSRARAPVTRAWCMTSATLARPPAFSMSLRAAGSGRPVSARTMRTARAQSLAFVGRTSTMRPA